MNGIAKRKKLLKDFSKYGLNECCCGGDNAQVCCGGNLYFTSKQGQIGIIRNNEQQIETIWKSGFYNCSCYGNYFAIKINNDTIVLFYKEKEVFNGLSSSIVIYYNDYIVINNDTRRQIFYSGKLIWEGSIISNLSYSNGSILFFDGDVFCFFVLGNKKWSGNSDSPPIIYGEFIVIKEGGMSKILYENVEIWSGSIDYIYYRSSYLRINNNVFYKDTLVFQSDTYTNDIFTDNSYFAYYNAGTRKNTVFYRNKLICEGENATISGDGKYGHVVVRNNNIANYNLYYEENLVGTLESICFGDWSKCDIALRFGGRIPECSISLFYKGQFVANIPYTYEGESVFSTVFCCNLFAVYYRNDYISIYSKNATLLSHSNVSYYPFCCGNRYCTYSDSSKKAITVFDEDFGKMEFDCETFMRLDGLS
jgi:hypothetical protein